MGWQLTSMTIFCLSLFSYLTPMSTVFPSLFPQSPALERKRLIIDTDLFSDVDDTAALLLACTHPGVDLVGVNINYPSTYTALAASSLLGYYNHSDVDIGLRRPFTNNTFFDLYYYKYGEYASKVAYHWSQYASLPWMNFENTWDPVQLYRKLLSEADDGVTIASIGFLDNISELLSSAADSFSPLSGADLVAAKVSELVIMGGEYPAGQEFNLAYNVTAAEHVINSWPGRIIFSGFELGKDVYSGGPLMMYGPADDPVNAAYRWYNGYNVPRESWDPLTVLYVIEGLGKHFQFGNDGGYNHIYPNGTNVWQMQGSPRSDHHYLQLKVSPSSMGAYLDRILLRGAIAARK